MRRPRCTHSLSASLASTPHLLVNGVLRCQGAFKGGIFSPARSGNIVQIALAELRSRPVRIREPEPQSPLDSRSCPAPGQSLGERYPDSPAHCES